LFFHFFNALGSCAGGDQQNRRSHPGEDPEGRASLCRDGGSEGGNPGQPFLPQSGSGVQRSSTV